MPEIVTGVDWKTENGDTEVLLKFSAGHLPVEVAEILTHFKKQGFDAEFDESRILKESKEASGEWRVVARGTLPVPPTHGYLEYFVDPGALDRKPEADESGNIDYKSLKLFMNVAEGEPLVRKHDPVQGKPGVDVYGKTIPPEEAHTVTLPAGNGVSIVEEGYLAVSSVAGAVTIVDDRLTVMDIFHVAGDVNYKTGNIDFNGSIDVGRDVLSGFSLKATGDIIVRGVVEAATLEAEGEIHIFGGFQGDGKGLLKAAGDIRVQYANEGKIEAGGSVYARSHLLNCEIHAAKDVEIDAAKGVLAGGETRAGESIVSPFLGSEAGVKTILTIGEDQDLPEKIKAAQEVIVALLKLKRPIDNRKKEVERMRRDLEKANKGFIVGTRDIYPGAIIRFPGTELEIKDPTGRRRIVCEKRKIVSVAPEGD